MRRLLILAVASFLANGGEIALGVESISFKKDGKEITIARENLKIPKIYQNTTRGVIAPMKIDKDIETIGELEVLDYLQKSAKDESIIVVDARTEDWYEKYSIPTAINLPYTLFNSKENALETLSLELDVEKDKNGKLDFSKAKTVVVYCNGVWCAQSAMLIKDAKYSLLKLGYPKDKIKYYRGGMQSWVSLGLTVKSN